MQFTSIPQIVSFQINYDVPTNLNIPPTQIDSIKVVNAGLGSMKKVIEFTKLKEYQRLWQN
jgi:hypothetical protein